MFFPSSPRSSPFIPISPEPCQNVLQLPFTLPCKQTGVPLSQKGSNECLERSLPTKSSKSFASTTAFYPAGKAQGSKCPHVTGGLQRLGLSSTENIQHGSILLALQERGRHWNGPGEVSVPRRRKPYSESVFLHLGTNPSVSLGRLFPDL